MSPRPKIGQASTPANTRSKKNSKNSPATSSSSGPSSEVSTCSSSTPNENTEEQPGPASSSKTTTSPSFSKVTKNKAASKSKAAARSLSPNAATGASKKQAIANTSSAQDAPSTSSALAYPMPSARPCTRSPIKNLLTESSIYKIVTKICNNENTPARLLTHSFVRYVLDEMHLLVSLENSAKKVRLMNQIAYDLAEFAARIDKPRSVIGGITESEAECREKNYHLNVTLMELRNIDSSMHELASRKIGIYNRLDANLFCRPPLPCMPDMPYTPEDMDVHCPKPGPSGIPVLHLPRNFSLEPMQIPMIPLSQPVAMVPPHQVAMASPSMQMMSPPIVNLPAPIPVPPPPPVPVPPPPPPPVPPPPPQNSNHYFDGRVVNAAAKSSCFVVPVKQEISITEGNPEDITVSKISGIKVKNLIAIKDAVVCSCKSGKIYKFLSKKNSSESLPQRMSKIHACRGPVAAMLVWNTTLIIATASGTIMKCSMLPAVGFKILKTFDVGARIICMTEIQGILYVSTKPSYLHIINLRSLTRLKDTVETGHLVKVLKNTFYNEEEILVCLNDKGEITGSAIHEGIIGSVVFKFTLPGVKMFDVYIKRLGPPRVTFFCGSNQNASCLHLEHGVFSQGRMVKMTSSAMFTYKHLNFLGSQHGDIMIVNITTMQTYVYSNVVRECIVSLLFIPTFLYIATGSGIYCLHLKNQDHFLRAAATH